MESGVKIVSKKFSDPLDDGMWNIFFYICIISSAVDENVWKSFFVWFNQVSRENKHKQFNNVFSV